MICAFRAIEGLDRAASRVFLYRLPRDLILDTILGPADSFEYVSTTAAPEPPTTS